MDQARELRDFLRSRRARLDPPDVGLPWRLGTRRVTGLRREELALAAGISVDYYSRLEQGRARNVSDQVLDALAGALKLNDLEREHLRRLARPDSASRRSSPMAPPKVSAAVRSMVEALDPTPALVRGTMHEVLAFNRMSAILFDNLSTRPPRERNVARWIFLDPRSRHVLPDWDRFAPQLVASLRRTAATAGDNPALNELIGELTVASRDFARWWADYELAEPWHADKVFHHDLVGDVTVHHQSLSIPQDPGQYLVLYTAPPGSPDAEKLALLSTWNPLPGAAIEPAS